MARTLLLDLDGTLVDTVPDLAAALNRLMRARGLPDFAHEQVAAMVGDGVAVLVARAFAAHGREPDADGSGGDDRRLYGSCRGREQACIPMCCRCWTNWPATGWQLAVCTNKPEQAARRLLAGCGTAAV